LDILIADTDPDRAAMLAARLASQIGVDRVRIAPPRENLAMIVAAERPDIVIVDMARPDRDSLEHLRTIAAHPMPVMLFVDEDDPTFMEEAISAGVVSYHVNAASITDIKPILRSAIALYRHASAREVRLAAAEAELSDRRVIESAKRLLMRRDKLTEPAAHRFLQRRAMERQMRLADVARALLAATPIDDPGDQPP
jgi:response regulator NasT